MESSTPPHSTEAAPPYPNLAETQPTRIEQGQDNQGASVQPATPDNHIDSGPGDLTLTSPPNTEYNLEDTQPIKITPEELDIEVAEAFAKYTSETQAAKQDYLLTAEKLASNSLAHLDKLLLPLIEKLIIDPKTGKHAKFRTQDIAGLAGIPGVISAGDLLGLIRAYYTLRSEPTPQGAIKAIAETLTALTPGIPTGITHQAIETIWPNPKPKISYTQLKQSITTS